MEKYKSGLIIIFCILLISSSAALFSKGIEFSLINPDKISNYKTDHIAFQRIERKQDNSKDDFAENYTITKDNSVENLLVIKDRKIYFIVDGFDSLNDVQVAKVIQDTEKKYALENDYWVNKINSKPDFIRVIYRRSDILVNSNEEFVTANYGAFYKSVRDRFIKMHVDKFRNLLTDRRESTLSVNKRLISYHVNPENSNDIKQKFFITAKAKSNDGTVYYCEDSDGDGITETFTATRNDGFDWGINSGPNLISIMGNTDKEIEKIIGKLVHESVNGSPEEENKVKTELLSEKDVINMMGDITPMDKFYE